MGTEARKCFQFLAKMRTLVTAAAGRPDGKDGNFAQRKSRQTEKVPCL